MTDTEHAHSLESFLPAILANPPDDLPRLVLCDWLEAKAGYDTCHVCNGVGEIEPPARRHGRYLKPTTCPECAGTGSVSNGYAERAEFIRTQIEIAQIEGRQRSVGPVLSRAAVLTTVAKDLLRANWSAWGPKGATYCLNFNGPGPGAFGVGFSRGFVSEVAGTLALWTGRNCGCTNWGRDASNWSRPMLGHPNCQDCKGDGVIPGIGPAVVAAHPIEKLTFTDKTADQIGEEFCWVRWRDGLRYDAGVIPLDLYDVLAGFDREETGTQYDDDDPMWQHGTHVTAEDLWKVFPTRGHANRSLSAAAIALAKKPKR